LLVQKQQLAAELDKLRETSEAELDAAGARLAACNAELASGIILRLTTRSNNHALVAVAVVV
jgi:flagellar motility protein MotE (MotC chaperone)